MKWTMKPITWGAYAKLCAVSAAISTVGYAVCWHVEYHDKVEGAFKKFFCKKS
jgi:hypothetical protein